MDFKGITWAGDMYQKFEEMCLEVEEIMCEDTAKYVENQVEKVSVSVKKFYAEIMQDLLPEDHVKVAAGDLPLKPYTRADINKKPKSDKLDIHRELDKKEIRDEDITDPTAEESSFNLSNDANRFSPLSPRVAVENTCSEKSKKVGIHKRPIGIKRISKNNHPPKRTASSSSSSRVGSNLLVYDKKSNYLVASGDMNVKRSSESFVSNDRPKHNTPISDASVESSSSESTDHNLSAERKEKNDPQSISSASDKILSYESLKQKKEASRKDWSLSQIRSNIGSSTCEVESEGEEVIVSYKDNFNVVVMETEDDVEGVEKSKLEESCILVELDKVPCVCPETKTHKSYKKKICEALSSKLRSMGKQDKDIGLRDKKEAAMEDPDNRKTCESEWELL